MSKKKPPPPAKGKKPRPAEGSVSALQKFVVKRVRRGDIKEASYNPRIIDDYARRKLRDGLRRDGLVRPLIWNARTGNLLEGHQRLSILDEEQGSTDYELDVAVVDLPLKAEKRLNVFLNNMHAQGMFDPDKLAALVTEAATTAKEATTLLAGMGFDKLAAEDLLADTDAASLLAAVAVPEADAAAVGELGAMSDAKRAESAAVKAATGGDDGDAPKTLENGEVIRDPEAHARIIAEREKSRAKMKAGVGNDDTEIFLVVTCADRAEREALNEALGIDPDSRYIAGARLLVELGVDLDPPTEETAT